MSGIAMLALAAGLSMVEVELREIEQAIVPPGSLSTAQARITPLGQILRVQVGGEAHWSLSFGPPRRARGNEVQVELRERPGRPPRADPQVLLDLRDAPHQRWNFSVRLLALKGEEAQLQLRWLEEQGHSEQAWSAALRLRLDHWTVVTRQPPGQAPPPGSISTQPQAAVRELQVRVRAVPE